MKKLALLLFGFAFPGIAMATNGILNEVIDACGYDPFAGTKCDGCHIGQASDPTDAKDQYMTLGACSFCPEADCTATTPPTETDLLVDAQDTTRAYMQDLFGLFTSHIRTEGIDNADPDKVDPATGAILDPSVFADVFHACPDIAPVSASNFSKDTGYLVRRVTTRTRNSRNIPDEWELAQLLNFEEMAANGDTRTRFTITKPDGTDMFPMEYEAYGVVAEGGGKDRKYYFRYMRSLTMPPHPKDATVATNPGLPCLFCHGTPGKEVIVNEDPLKTIPELAPGVLDQVSIYYPFDRALGYSMGDIRGAWTIKIPLSEKPAK